MQSVELVEQWPVESAATAVVSNEGDVIGAHGELERVYRLASVTKPLTAYSVLLAVEEGVLALDDPVDEDGVTIRHLLAHTSGLDMEQRVRRAAPGTRRIYSNAGFEVLAEVVAERSGIPFQDYVTEGVLHPLGMSSTRFEGSPAAGASSTVADLARFAAEV